MLRVFCLLAIFSVIGGVPVKDLAGCAVDYLTQRNLMNSSSSETFKENCESRITQEITNFHNELRNLITTGVNVDHLENFNFINHETCIIGKLQHYNVSDLYLKGIAYQELDKVHHSDHSFNLKMTSQQILLLYALQVCEPRSFYARHAEKIFTMNMRTTSAQAHCLLNHLNENSVDEPYQLGDTTESIGDLQSYKCDDIVRTFVKKYYNVIDKARSFSIFGLNPVKAMQCRMNNDKELINHMILITIFPRLHFTTEQIEDEKIKFFEIARNSAKSFFQCISLYD